ASQPGARANPRADQLGAPHDRQSRQARRAASAADPRGTGAALGAARRGRLPRLRLEGQDAAPAFEYPARPQRRIVPAALEPAERSSADRAELFGAALK